MLVGGLTLTASVLLPGSTAMARDTVFVSPPLRSPVGGMLQCSVFNSSDKKVVEGISVAFRRVNGGTSGPDSTCGNSLVPLTGCSATLAGFCETLPCACVFGFTRGDKKALRGSLMAVDGAGTVTGAVELHR
jgi:hypothetical protein